jgi:WD40 repeat protein
MKSSLKVFDIIAGKEIAEIKAHADTITSLKFTNNGNAFVSTSLDGVATLWNSFNFDGIASFGCPSRNKCYFANFLRNDKIGVLFEEGIYRQWDLRTQQCLMHVPKQTDTKCITSFAWDENSIFIPNGDSVNVVKITQNPCYYNRIEILSKKPHCGEIGYVTCRKSILVTCGLGLDASAVIWKETYSDETSELEIDLDRILDIKK